MANLNLHRIDPELLTPMRGGDMTRLVYFGSSNTQRCRPGMHWGDWLELGLKKQYGAAAFQVFNAGIGGQTTRDLLGRFERDVRALHPNAVLITIGGNDCQEKNDMSEDEYRKNLLDLHQRITELGATTIFQTYYGCDLPNIPAKTGRKLNTFMQIKRDVAASTGSPLIDQYERWQPLMGDRALVGQLLVDPFHTTEMGNAVMGLNLLRAFDCPLTSDMRIHAADAWKIDHRLENGSPA